MITKEQSATFDYLKGALPFFVVFVHSYPGVDFHWNDSIMSYIALLMMKLAQAVIPCFFLISGYLFFNKFNQWKRDLWLCQLKKKSKTIFIPYIAWNIIAIIGLFFFNQVKIHSADLFSVNKFISIFSINGGLRQFYDRPYFISAKNILGYFMEMGYPADMPLWYMRDLIWLFLLSPLIWSILAKFGWKVFPGFFALYVLNIGIPFSGFSLVGILFFSAGGYYAIYRPQFLKDLYKIRLIWYILSIVSLNAVILFDFVFEQYIFRLSWIFWAISFFCISYHIAVIKGHKIHPVLRDSGFFIYALHYICILEISNFILYHILPFENGIVSDIKIFLRPLLSFSLCLVLFVVIRRFTPKTLSVLTGGRY